MPTYSYFSSTVSLNYGRGMMNIFISFWLFLLTILIACLLLLRSSRTNKNASENLGFLILSFQEREKIVELRSKNATTKISEVEVKTIRQTYFVVRMEGRKILSKTEIGSFTILESESRLIGKIDPICLDHIEIRTIPLKSEKPLVKFERII